MIPRVIYQIWISDKPMPEHYKKYHDTWSLIMPDFEIKTITLADVPKNDFLDKLIQLKRWTVVGNYLRHYLLYHNGGLYFDNDIQVVKSFNDLLEQEIIIGWEDDKHINTAVMGCNKGNVFMGECLKYMEKLDLSVDKLELWTGPWMATELKDYIVNEYPINFFYPYHYSEKFTPECIKPETYTVHHWEASWTEHPKII